jgi:hypothetical protein
VYAYRVLVSRAEVPEWVLRPIRGLAYQPDLYTSLAGGQEVDEFERWIAKEYEEPGLQASDKLLAGCSITASDWQCLARLVAVQDVRTPLNFIEFKKLYDEQAPGILDECVEEFKRRVKSGPVATASIQTPSGLAEAIRVHVEPAGDQVNVQVEAASRKLWLASQRHVLMHAAAELCQHRWSVATPDGDEEWPLTDHPVLRLNWYKPGHYDFCGGWGNKGSEIIMPISPRHLLYVKVGTKMQNRFTFSREHTRVVQRLIVERAHRWVFARRPVTWVAQAKPRVVDETAFLAEQDAWLRWSQEQLHAEAQLMSGVPE